MASLAPAVLDSRLVPRNPGSVLVPEPNQPQQTLQGIEALRLQVNSRDPELQAEPNTKPDTMAPPSSPAPMKSGSQRTLVPNEALWTQMPIVPIAWLASVDPEPVSTHTQTQVSGQSPHTRVPGPP